MFIKRFDKWDLPKGKREKGESIEQCAIREVEEECLVSKLKIIKQLPETYHCYQTKNKNVFKISYWFLMSCDDYSNMNPQIEEGITELRWLNQNELNIVFENTYSSIKDLLISIFPEYA